MIDTWREPRQLDARDAVSGRRTSFPAPAQAEPDAARRRPARRRLSPAADGLPLHRLRRLRHARACAATASSRASNDVAGRRRRGRSDAARGARCSRRRRAPRSAPTSTLEKRLPLGGGPGRRQLRCRDGAARAQSAVGHAASRASGCSRSALELGADVPVFVFGENALGRRHRRAPDAARAAGRVVSRADARRWRCRPPGFSPIRN